MLRAGAETGLRRGEVIALRWRDVVVADRRLVVSETIWQQRGGEKVIQTPKGGYARRVAITPGFAHRLRELRIASSGDGEGYIWPGAPGLRWGRACDAGP
jgi:integrase